MPNLKHIGSKNVADLQPLKKNPDPKCFYWMSTQLVPLYSFRCQTWGSSSKWRRGCNTDCLSRLMCTWLSKLLSRSPGTTQRIQYKDAEKLSFILEFPLLTPQSKPSFFLHRGGCSCWERCIFDASSWNLSCFRLFRKKRSSWSCTHQTFTTMYNKNNWLLRQNKISSSHGAALTSKTCTSLKMCHITQASRCTLHLLKHCRCISANVALVCGSSCKKSSTWSSLSSKHKRTASYSNHTVTTSSTSLKELNTSSL